MRFFRVRLHSTQSRANFLALPKHPFAITGIECNSCNSTWANFHAMPYECPESMRAMLAARKGPLSVAEHRRLQSTCRSAFAIEGFEIPSIRPGWRFLPSVTGVWKYRPGDFLAASPASLIVSQRVADCFKEQKWQGFEAFPTTVLSLPPSISQSALSDISRKWFLDDFTAHRFESMAVDELYCELVITGASRPVWPVTEECQTCGKVSYLSGSFEIPSGAWSGEHLFTLSPTASVIVVEEVKECIQESAFHGLAFEEIRAVQ